jgi:hypothetical protein
VRLVAFGRGVPLGILAPLKLLLGTDPVLMCAAVGAAFFLIVVVGQLSDFRFFIEMGADR